MSESEFCEQSVIHTNPLCRDDFLKTMGSSMKDITADAEPVVDIWEYGRTLLKG